MAALTWDDTGKKLYETGIDHGVLYVQKNDGTYDKGVAWNGLTSVDDSPSGGDANDIYADNIKYLSLRAAEDYGFTINAYTYPDEFMACDGSIEIADGVVLRQQARTPFGFVYRTIIGNDTSLDSYGYKLHLAYNATVSPSEKSYSTVNDSPEAIEFSWEATTTPVSVAGYKPSASIEISSVGADAEKLKTLEDKLFGTTDTEPTLPTIAEVISIFKTT